MAPKSERRDPDIPLIWAHVSSIKARILKTHRLYGRSLQGDVFQWTYEILFVRIPNKAKYKKGQWPN